MAIRVRIPTNSAESHSALFRPWKLPWRPFQIHSTYSKGRGTQHWRRAQSEESTVIRRYSSSAQQQAATLHHNRYIASCTQQRTLLTHNGAAAQNHGCIHMRASTELWRCFASAEGRVEEGEDEEGGEGNSERDGMELGLAPAFKQLQLEQKKPGYVGRALREGKGAEIAQLLRIFGHLLESPYGGGKSVANAGGAVIERAASDAQALRGQEGVHDQIVFEMLKMLRLLEVDMDMIRAANKEETLLQRLETARAHCKQALLIASSF